MEIEELARKVSDLERKIDDIAYDLHRAMGELQDEIARKANESHSHETMH